MLFSPTHAFGRLEDQFADQFEPDGELNYLYRRSSRGAPVRVTAAERDGFVVGYRQASRRLRWGVVAGVIVVAAAFVAVGLLVGLDDWGDRSHGALEGAIALLVLLFVALHLRAWSAPARALERRPQLGAERSRAEMRRLIARRMSWGQVLGFLVLVPLAGMQFGEAKRGSAMRWLWLAVMVVGLAATASLAWRKWRLSREP
jgi:hypothetical protein